MVVLLPLTVTTTCIGKAPSGTAAATKVLVSLLNVSQLGSGCPFAVVTTMGALLPTAELSACAGSVKLKPLPVVDISFGTETVMMPDCCNDGWRTSAIETPLLPTPPAAPVVLLLEDESALAAA